MQVFIKDQSGTGAITHEMMVEFLTEHITLRELIRGRVYQEVQDYNLARGNKTLGIEQLSRAPSTTAFTAQAKTADFQTEFDRAIDAFQRSRYFVLVGDQQPMDLDEEIVLRPDTEVTFVRLVYLAGG
ncbi:MAG: hypothetical protein GX455_16515 [Phycisphaerae bacterium]|nr:hypothetical protein [Phycisphaerae bacterium]